MSKRGAGEPEHDHADKGGVDVFALLDIAIWCAVAVVAIVGLDMLFGKIIRERLASGASRYLQRLPGRQAAEGTSAVE
jgi:hypothetical protein